MKFYSTRDINKENPVSFLKAVLNGLAPDGGLYMPENIPILPKYFYDNIEHLSNEEIAFTVAKSFIGNEIPDDILLKMVTETINFPLPIIHLKDNIYTLELFHGPTMAFKDIGARFMARVMGYSTQSEKKKIKVIAATSGDTGSAVAAGFYNVAGIDVYIIYPSGKVSPLQEKQLTSWGGNIHAIELNGNFDDCQKLAKELLSDNQLAENDIITSANSISIARLLPQSFYYFFIYKALKIYNLPITISVPSGNFGNLTGGIIAKKMGLPIQHFIAATNENKIVPHYLNSGKYNPLPSVKTISNAMDVGNPSNFERMSIIYENILNSFKEDISGIYFSDIETKEIMQKIYANEKYILDPHGAIGLLGLLKNDAIKNKTSIGIFLETAHPAKFKEIVEDVLETKIELPTQLAYFSQKEKKASFCENNYIDIKKLI